MDPKLVKPKVLAGGIGGTVAALVMSIVQGFWPDMNIPAGLEGFIAAVIGFAVGWLKKE